MAEYHRDPTGKIIAFAGVKQRKMRGRTRRRLKKYLRKGIKKRKVFRF